MADKEQVKLKRDARILNLLHKKYGKDAIKEAIEELKNKK